MPSTWERATVVTPERLTAVDDATVELDSYTRYAILPESGWGALIGWLAGSERLIGCRDDIASHHIVVTEDRDGTSTPSIQPRWPADQAVIDDDINSYLLDAGAEPQPAGLRWFALLPENGPAGRLWEITNRAAAAAPPHPSALLQPVRAALQDFYGD